MRNIRPELKRLHSPDIFDLDSAAVDCAAPFCILVQALFGSQGEKGEESFDLLVCNPKWVAERTREGVLCGRHHLIVQEFDIVVIRRFFFESTKELVGSTWDEVAEKIGRIAKWEFEDYID